MRRGLTLSIVLATVAAAVMVAAGLAMAAQIGGEKALESSGSKRGESAAAGSECSGAEPEGGDPAPGTDDASCPAEEKEPEASEGEGGAGEGESTAGEQAGGVPETAEPGPEAGEPEPEATAPAPAEAAEPAGSGRYGAGQGEVVRGAEIGGAEAAAPQSGSEGDAGADKHRHHGSKESKGSADEGEGAANGGATAPASAGGEGSGSLSSLAIGNGESTLDSLEVPVSLMPVYQACGSDYGISWEVLAAINKVETNFGTDLGTSSAGAEGWMQFLPSTWKQWGIDADGDGDADAADPVDAICSAARYLAASGGESDIYDAVLAYNHADWYANEVLADARQYERAPANLVNSLTELAAGSTFPVAGKVSYWNQAKAEAALDGVWADEEELDSEGGGEEESVRIGAEVGADVQAVASGTITRVGNDAGGGSFVVLTDAYGDRFVYSSLGGTEAESGESVEEGDVIGRVGETSVGFAVRPDGSSKLDPTELLEIWKRGGVGQIYSVDTTKTKTTGETAEATRSLLMSSAALSREVLADDALTLPRCVRKAVAGGDIQRQSLANLEYLTAGGYELGVAASTCQRRSGFVVEIESIDGKAVTADDGQGQARSLVRDALAMDGAAAPQRVVSATGVAGSAAGKGTAKTIELDYRPPEQARLVDGEAVAPTDAPAAVQAMIAAANQIDDQPYVWGGGHGAWVSEGYDCSGSVSYVLHAAKMLSSPQTSGALASWGESGTGRWVTVYANAEHTYAVIAGLRWDTVGDVSGSGPRWHTGAAYPAGFAVRHPSGY